MSGKTTIHGIYKCQASLSFLPIHTKVQKPITLIYVAGYFLQNYNQKSFIVFSQPTHNYCAADRQTDQKTDFMLQIPRYPETGQNQGLPRDLTRDPYI